MALRIIQAHVPPDLCDDAREVLGDVCQESWDQEGGRFGAVACGILGADPATPELASRTRVEIWDLVLALAAGCAGAFSYTTGVPTFLTGVMVAVALLPPAVASGMLLAAGETEGSLAALLLAAGNVTALTLAAMLTFLGQGMRPRNWWQEDRARRSARRGVAIFVALLAALAGLILLSQGWLGSGRE